MAVEMVMPEIPADARVDLTPFRLDNQRKRSSHVPWSERSQMIKEHVPSVYELDWRQAFDDDIDLFARLMRDILRIDPSQPRGPGPRPALELADAASQLQRMMGEDHTVLEFHEAFAIMSRGTSRTQLARKTGITRSRVHRLLAGQEPPTVEQMEQVAVAFGKHPSYFNEWRRAVIMQAVADRLKWSPETSILLYRRLLGRA